MTISRVLPAGVLLLFAVACGDGGGTIDAVAESPDGTTYVVTGATVDGERHDLVPGSEIRLAFADGQLRITAGCNSMTGAYDLADSRLTVEPMATTDMGCDRPLMEQDAWVAGLFEDSVQFTGGSVISGNTVLNLTDRREVSPDLPLAATVWTLDGIGSGGGADGSVSSVPADVRPPTLRITENGRADVFDGCNRGTGPAIVDEKAGTVDFGARGTTRMACPDASGVAAAVHDVLEGLTTYAITERTLTITNGDASLMYRAG